jgi:hypothetical protein
MTSVRLMSAIVVCVTFGGVLAITVAHERRRRATSALPLPDWRTDWRTTLGNALVEAVVMIGAVAIAVAAIVMRNH